MHFARQGRALVVTLGIGALAGWAPVGAAAAQTCGYNYTGCTQPSVPAYSVGTSPTTATAADASHQAPAAAPDAPSASPAAAEPQSGGLPFTGTDTLSTAAAGAAAIGAGAVLVRRSRRRRPARR